MVLRGLIVNPNLTVSDIPEPLNIPTGYPKLKSPFDFDLNQNYPNPFNSSTMIEYRLVNKSMIKLEIFDITGRLITQPINQTMQPGIYQTFFDAGNLVSGVYFYTLTVNGQSVTKKMIIAK